MSFRKEEIIKKGFIKSLLEGTLELKDLAGININLDIARQAYLQGVQEATQELIELVKAGMATAAKQDLLKGVMDEVQTAVETVQGYDEELHEFDPVVIFDDDETTLTKWTGGGEGSYDITLTEDKIKMKKGVSCSKWVVGAGAFRDVGLYREYTVPEDFSDKKNLSLWWYGSNTGQTILIKIWDDNGVWGTYNSFVDDFTGWKRIDKEMTDFISATIDMTVIKRVYVYLSPNQMFTSYLDRIIADNMKTRLGGAIAKLVEQKVKLDDIFSGMATGAKQDLQATAAKQDTLKTVLDNVQTAIDSVDAKADSLSTSAKQDLLKGVSDLIKTAVESMDSGVKPVPYQGEVMIDSGNVTLDSDNEKTLYTLNGMGKCDYIHIGINAAVDSSFVNIRVKCDDKENYRTNPDALNGWGFSAETPKISLLKHAADGINSIVLSIDFEFNTKLEITGQRKAGSPNVIVRIYGSANIFPS